MTDFVIKNSLSSDCIIIRLNGDLIVHLWTIISLIYNYRGWYFRSNSWPYFGITKQRFPNNLSIWYDWWSNKNIKDQGCYQNRKNIKELDCWRYIGNPSLSWSYLGRQRTFVCSQTDIIILTNIVPSVQWWIGCLWGALKQILKSRDVSWLL